jgi:hypothetical protein
MKRILWTYSMLLACQILLAAGWVHTVVADQQARAFLDGVRYYESKEYTNAIEAFNKIVEGGIQNGKLYYNLANAYLKNGDIGPAVLWYERSLKLMPKDPDLRFNLAYANTLVTDKTESSSSPLLTVMFFWKDLFSVATWQGIALGFNACCWISLAVWYLLKKRVFKTMGYCFILITCISLGAIFYHAFVVNYRPQAIILPASVSVRSGLASESTELFVLHAGTRVAVEKQTKGFFRIRFSKDKIGWIKDTSAGTI